MHQQMKNERKFSENAVQDEENLSDPDDSIRKMNEFSRNRGFRNIVRRLQLAARVSASVNYPKEDKAECYHEDAMLNAYNRSLRRRSTTLRGRSPSRYVTEHSLHVLDISDIGVSAKNESGTSKTPINRHIHGEIKFLNDELNFVHKPYIAISSDSPLEDVTYIFKDLWQLEVPKIITLVITGKSHKSRWQNKKQIESFKTGIAKAAMSTNMWIVTNGLNCGPTSHICCAIESELKNICLKRFSKIENIPLLLGISSANDLTYGSLLSDFTYSESVVCVENKGTGSGQKFELNPNHSNFIIAKNARDSDELHQFTLSLIYSLIKGKEFSDSTLNVEIPLVSILIDGEPENINFILELIKKQIPVVVLQGSGGLADIVAYAYSRIWDAISDNLSKDAEHIEQYVKPSLVKKIGAQFGYLKSNNPMCAILRDQVIECVRLSKQNGRQHLIILDMHQPNCCNLSNLSEHLLYALLKSRRNLQCNTQEQILKDFDLIMDWNCAEVAKNLLFIRNITQNITEPFQSKFFNVLTRSNREQFVEVFLGHGFQLHKFLTPSRLNRLFRFIHDLEFFKTVCWESALGQASNAKQNKFFIENDLNWLIEYGTGLENFVNSEDLYQNSLGMYTSDSMSAERKALTLLAIWAVMQNRYELAKVLWKYCDHPVHLALIVSMLFERLSWNVMDTNLKTELEQNSKQFADYANGVLDQCYNENISQAYNVLRESIVDWNYMTAVDIAASAQLKQFLAHPCCQKWLTNTFQGKIRLREITWGFFTIPISIKILLCSLLVFPMYIWVQFKSGDCESSYSGAEIEEELDVYESMYTNLKSDKSARSNSKNELGHFKSHTISSTSLDFNNFGLLVERSGNGGGVVNKAFDDHEMAKNEKSQANHSHRPKVFVKKQPPIWRMIQMMWCSPITKFYTSQLFYMIFLVIFSMTTLYPNCGHFWLDLTVCAWTFLITIGQIRHTYILLIKYSSISFYPKLIEIILMLSFVSIWFITRIMKFYFYPIYAQKIIISIALLFFYYRMISIYLPISPTLGPLLYRFRLMITVDFVNYMRITLVILISNAIVIQALHQPFLEITMKSVGGVIHQGLLSLFYGPPTEIKVSIDQHNREVYCPAHPDHQRMDERESTIEDESLMMYMFVFQYFIVLKLIAGPLLFSIFSVTASKWVQEIEHIWKFQRYHLVIDFANRLPIPEPFSFVYYIYLMLHQAFRWIASILRFDISVLNKKTVRRNFAHNIISPEDCLCWKQLAAEYLENEKKISEESKIIHKEWECVQEISVEIEYEKKVLRKIKSKLTELEKTIRNTKLGEQSDERHCPNCRPTAPTIRSEFVT